MSFRSSGERRKAGEKVECKTHSSTNKHKSFLYQTTLFMSILSYGGLGALTNPGSPKVSVKTCLSLDTSLWGPVFLE